MNGMWKDFHKDLAESEARMRAVNKSLRAIDATLYPDKKPPQRLG